MYVCHFIAILDWVCFAVDKDTTLIFYYFFSLFTGEAVQSSLVLSLQKTILKLKMVVNLQVTVVRLKQMQIYQKQVEVHQKQKFWLQKKLKMKFTTLKWNLRKKMRLWSRSQM